MFFQTQKKNNNNTFLYFQKHGEKVAGWDVLCLDCAEPELRLAADFAAVRVSLEEEEKKNSDVMKVKILFLGYMLSQAAGDELLDALQESGKLESLRWMQQVSALLHWGNHVADILDSSRTVLVSLERGHDQVAQVRAVVEEL